MKILIVDDKPETVSLLINWLSKRGHDVLGITGGRDVASWVERESCDVVLLDVLLPDVNGLTLISDVATTGAKVIVMSDLPREMWADQAIRNGAFACLPKSLMLSELQDLLERLSPSE
jgi:DNA-binding NtrC family response regulator